MKKTNQNLKKILIEKLIKAKPKNREAINEFKRKIAAKFKTSPPSNVDLLETYHSLVKNKRVKKTKELERLLLTRPVRSLSGIVNVSVLTKPYFCPGQCVFCPSEKGFPKSYLTGEPAADRAKFLNFNPYLQVKKRIEMLREQGHPTDKIELRIVGGTWSAYPKRYQTWFIKRCFQASNENRRKTLESAQKANEKAKNKIVGLSIETRPDFITKKEILRLRKLGVTLVELGVQTVFDDVLKKCRTGLTNKKIEKATRLLKDAGFKVLYQVMLNLPGSNLKKDLKAFKILFENEWFKPDWLKIYPCVVCQNTLLYRWWQKGQYQPYSKKDLVNLLIQIKKNLPFWVRVTRIFRDIPAQKIKAGCKTSNLREVAQKEMAARNLFCRCIRCREVKEKYSPKEKICLFREDYPASAGKEIFLSFENQERTKLFSLLRLRIPSFYFSGEPHFIKVLDKTAIIRELQTFGFQLPILKSSGKKSSASSPQHKGLGRKLIQEAEKIAKKEFGLKKIAVISGIGARQYYRKLKYRLRNTYMVKTLESSNVQGN